MFAMGAANNANNRQKNQQKIMGAICVVTANDQNWRTTVPKVWIPHSMLAKSIAGQNNPAKLAEQAMLVNNNGGTTANTVRFSVCKRIYARRR